MKNKEIVKRLKDSLDYEFDLSFSDRKELLSCIEQLEVDYKEANDSVTWWQNRYNAIERDRKNILNLVDKLQNNRDKALKIIDSYELGKYDYSIPPGGIIELREALKGDSDYD